MERNHLQPNHTHNASFAPNTAADASQQGAQPEARPVPPLENAADLSAHPASRSLQEYSASSTPQGSTEHLVTDDWSLPDYQPIQPGEPYMEKLADEAMNTKKVGILLKHAQDYEELGDFKDAEKAYKKALKHTEDAEHYKLYGECLQKISASLKDEAKASVYREKAARAFYYLGELYQKQGALQEAQAAYKVACDLAVYEVPLKAWVEVTRQLGDATELAAALEKLADFYAEKGKIDLAIEKLKEAFEVGKAAKILEKLEGLYRQEGGEDALEKLADFYAEQKEIALAIERLKEVFELGKAARILEKLEVLYRQVGGEDALEKLADFYAEKGEIALAIDRLKEVFEARKSFAILDKLEALYRQEGGEDSQSQLHDIAIQRFELKIQENPKNIGLYRKYAWFLKDLGRKSEAKAVNKRMDERLQAMQQKIVKQKAKIGDLKQTIHLQAGKLEIFEKHAELLEGQVMNFSKQTGIQDADLISLLNKNPYTKVLNLEGCERLTDAVLRILPECFESLQELNLRGCKGITEAGLDTLAENASKLKRLTLDYCPGTTVKLLHKLNTKGIAFSIEGVMFKQNILDLSARKDTLTDEELRQALDANPEITELCLSQCTKITEAGLSPLKNFQWLRSLNLQGCTQLTGAGLQYLSGLTQLTSLNLNSCTQLTGAGFQHLARLTQLTSLDLRFCTQLTGAGLQYFSGLTRLTSLDLYECTQLTDAGLQYLAGLTQLTSLSLQNCTQLTGAGLQYLARMTQLTSLDLYGCNKLTDQDLKHLAGLTQLWVLNLQGCTQLTDAGLQHLARMTKLRNLGLSGSNKFTNNAKEQLKKRIPGLTING